MISLRQALAVSCNTAFIGMAGTLGWPKVRDTALALGFQLRAQPEGAQPLALGRGAETTVGPDTAQGAQIGNDGLGGGGVEGAPLQMAAMIATIANEGRAVQPSLVTAVRRPGSHRTESVTGCAEPAAQPGRCGRCAYRADRRRLACGGRYRAHTLAGRTAASSTSRPAPMSWSSPTRRRLLGCSPDCVGRRVLRDHRPVSFAAVVETRDETEGPPGVRDVARSVIAAVVGARGGPRRHGRLA
jgi:hypothetical protein